MKRIDFLKVVVALVVLALGCSFVFGVSEEAKKYYENAKMLYVAGDVEGAIAELEKALAIEPNYEQARRLYEKLGGGKKTDKKGVESSQSYSPQPYGVQLQTGMLLDRDKMKEGVRSIMSNMIAQVRADILQLMMDVIKDSFVEVIRGEDFLKMKGEVKLLVKEVVKDLVEEEINEAFHSIKAFSSGTYTNEFRIRKSKDEGTKERRINENFLEQRSFVQGENEVLQIERKKKAAEMYNKAIKLLEEENYKEAKKMLEEASKLDPENQEILKSLRRISKME